jgi:hypothetical protein
VAPGFSEADLVRIAVDDAPVLDSDTVDRVQRLIAPHLEAFMPTKPVAAVTELPAPDDRETPGVAA